MIPHCFLWFLQDKPDARPFHTKLIEYREGCEQSFESETTILEESSTTDEGITSRGNAPADALEVQNKGTGSSRRPVQMRTRPVMQLLRL